MDADQSYVVRPTIGLGELISQNVQPADRHKPQTTANMAKRKAKEADLGESKDGPRRSSRRTTTAAEEEVKLEVNGASTASAASTPVKKGASKKTKVAAKVEKKVVPEEEEKVVKKVRSWFCLSREDFEIAFAQERSGHRGIHNKDQN